MVSSAHTLVWDVLQCNLLNETGIRVFFYCERQDLGLQLQNESQYFAVMLHLQALITVLQAGGRCSC